jgi:glycosyltransferase involved in cell wall biosynthesis
MEKISVVTINLNRCIDLERTIKSVVSQNLTSDVEYVVIDGMSNDDSLKVIERYKDYIDIAIVEEDDGIFNAMNKGLDLARGDYIYFLNSGDVFADSRVLKDVVNAIDSSGDKFNIICGKVDLYDDDKYLMTADLYPWIPHQGAFVKTCKLRSYRFDESFRIYGDLDLWTRMRKQSDYSVFFLDRLITNFELGGVGNNPNYLSRQYEDKKKYLRKHNHNFISLLSAQVAFYLDVLVYSFLGRKLFFKYKKVVSIPKKMTRKMLNA